MNSALAIQILPHMDDEKEMLHVVDKVIQYIQSTGLNYHVGPFETTIEGDFDQLIEVIKQCHLLAEEAGAKSMHSAMKLFYSPKKHLLTTDEKISKYQG